MTRPLPWSIIAAAFAFLAFAVPMLMGVANA